MRTFYRNLTKRFGFGKDQNRVVVKDRHAIVVEAHAHAERHPAARHPRLTAGRLWRSTAGAVIESVDRLGWRLMQSRLRLQPARKSSRPAPRG